MQVANIVIVGCKLHGASDTTKQFNYTADTLFIIYQCAIRNDTQHYEILLNIAINKILDSNSSQFYNKNTPNRYYITTPKQMNNVF